VRKRAPLVGLLLAVGLVLVAPVAAHAQEGEGEGEFTPEQIEEIIHEAELVAEQNGASEFDVHCIPELIEGGRVDDCQEAPSPIVPPTNELIWGGLSFLIVFLLIWRFGWPAMKKGLEARTERIRSDLEQADSARAEAETVLSDYQQQVAGAKSEAAGIIEEARQTADSMKRDLQAQAEADIAAMRQKAAADIEAAKAQALADLRNEVASIAIGAAERVVERNLDPATNTALVESFIDQVGAGRSN
jgi:F-type H+-transporting ATPase subunit b